MNEQSCQISRTKVLVVGLDGGNWTGLTPLLEAGIMPNLKSLIEGGSSGILESTIPPATAPAWSSFQTGKYPNRHGIIDFFMYQPWSYVTEFTTSNHLKGNTLWKLISDSGKRVIAVNLPMTYPPEKVNGVIIPGFDAPDTVAHSTHPEGILETLEKKMGSYRHYRKGWNDKAFQAGGIENLIRELWAYTDTQVEVVKFLMSDSEWDVCMYHFQAHDAFQHYAWELIDQNAPPYMTKPENQKSLLRISISGLMRRLANFSSLLVPIQLSLCFPTMDSRHYTGVSILIIGFATKDICVSPKLILSPKSLTT